jgi:hypothetical protein
MPGRLDHELGAELSPGQLGRIAFRADRDLHPIHHDRVLRGGHLARVAAVDRVVFQEVGQRLGVGEVVDADDLEVLAARRAEHQAPDPPETIDPDPRRHVPISSLLPTPRGTGTLAFPRSLGFASRVFPGGKSSSCLPGRADRPKSRTW